MHNNNLMNWTKTHLSIPLYQNAYLLMLMRVMSTLLSYIFWVLAARLMAAGDIGIAMGGTSSAMLLSGFAHLGLGYGLVRLQSHEERPEKLINFSLQTAGVAGLSLAVVFMAGIPFWSPELIPLRQVILTGGMFILLVISLALSRIVFYVFLAARQMVFGLIKQTMQSFLAVLLLIIFSGRLPGFQAALTAYTLGIFASLCLALILIPYAQPGFKYQIAVPAANWRRFTRYSLVNYLLEQAQNVPGTLLPVLVLNISGALSGAYFSIPWSVGCGLVALAGSISESLFTEGAHNPKEASQFVKRSIRFALLISLGMMAGLIVIGKFLLGMYGPDYTQNGIVLLYLVGAAVLPETLIMILISLLRIQDRMNLVFGILVFSFVIGVAFSLTGLVVMGIAGAGLGWLTARILVVVVVLLGWRLRQQPASIHWKLQKKYESNQNLLSQERHR